MSCSWNGVETVLVPDWKYYLGFSRKSIAIHARSEMSCWRSVPPCVAASRVWKAEIGIGKTLVGGVSSLL